MEWKKVQATSQAPEESMLFHVCLVDPEPGKPDPLAKVRRSLILGPDSCAWCGKMSFGNLSCESCHVAKYCDAACQKSHWEQRHKAQCKKTSKLSSSERRIIRRLRLAYRCFSDGARCKLAMLVGSDRDRTALFFYVGKDVNVSQERLGALMEQALLLGSKYEFSDELQVLVTERRKVPTVKDHIGKELYVLGFGAGGHNSAMPGEGLFAFEYGELLATRSLVLMEFEMYQQLLSTHQLNATNHHICIENDAKIVADELRKARKRRKKNAQKARATPAGDQALNNVVLKEPEAKTSAE